MMNDQIKCADAEILLADYLDGMLAPEERLILESHFAACSACGELAQDASAAAGLLTNLKDEVMVPPTLVRGILHATSRKSRFNFMQWLSGLSWSGVLQPRWVMSAAMAALSVVMIGWFWGFAEDTAYRTWDRAMKRYDNLAVVYDVQNQLDDWRAQLGAVPATEDRTGGK